MRTSTQGLAILVEREGARNRAYLDSVGVWTIGVGHTGPEVCQGLVWTDDEVRNTLAEDVRRFEDAVNFAVKVPLKQHQFDALVSFAFNIGVTGFSTSTLVKKINAGLFDEVPAQFDRWHIPPEITSRRNAEREQFKGNSFHARLAA